SGRSWTVSPRSTKLNGAGSKATPAFPVTNASTASPMKPSMRSRRGRLPPICRPGCVQLNLMRQIILDTETTGLEPELGHRIIEIGCVEVLHRRETGRSFPRYVNPEREIEEGALAVHGISRAELNGKPRFAEIVEELLAFIS